MGFFRNLWDEALASDSGIGKFRRYNSLVSRPPTTGQINNAVDVDIPGGGVSRSITILRSNSLSSSGSTPSSPTGSSAAGSPAAFSATSSPGGDVKKLTRRKSTTDARGRETKSPTGYDWIVLTSLDR